MHRPFSPVHILISLRQILPSLGVTLTVVTGTVILGIFLSLLLVRQELSKKFWWNGLAKTYVHILRCTPSIVLLFIVFYGIPKIVFLISGANINFWPKIIFVIFTLSLLDAPPLSQRFRAAYTAVGKSQFEAVISVGLSPCQTVTRIMIPQAIVYALPNLGNSLIALLKEGSLAYTIGLIDVM